MSCEGNIEVHYDTEPDRLSSRRSVVTERLQIMHLPMKKTPPYTYMIVCACTCVVSIPHTLMSRSYIHVLSVGSKLLVVLNAAIIFSGAIT